MATTGLEPATYFFLFHLFNKVIMCWFEGKKSKPTKKHIKNNFYNQFGIERKISFPFLEAFRQTQVKIRVNQQLTSKNTKCL